MEIRTTHAFVLRHYFTPQNMWAFQPQDDYALEDIIETLNRQLSPEEVELILLRYGLKDLPGAKKLGAQPTIAELSTAFGLKPDKVRRMINKSLKQLQMIIGDEWSDYEREFQ